LSNIIEEFGGNEDIRSSSAAELVNLREKMSPPD